LISDELLDLARVLADWAAPASGATIYLYGSRVRGDHRPDSDVDVCLDFRPDPGKADVEWWTANNQDLFTEINKWLPGPIHVLPMPDPLRQKIIAAPVAHQDRNVRCVWLPPHRSAIHRPE
jgi:predicted nucleotidyltransferase